MCWSRKNTTFHFRSVARISATTSGASGWLRSTPWISAPMYPASGRTSSAVVTVMRLMQTQTRGFAKQRGMMDVGDALRSGAKVMEWDLRQAATGGGAFGTITADSVSMRSQTAFGIVCAKHATLARYGLSFTSGSFTATADDTLLALKSDGSWKRTGVSQVGTPAGLGVPTCTQPAGVVPDVVVEFVGALDAGVVVGAP